MESVNLKPTNYCTAMWNGVRCSGEHESHGEIYHSSSMNFLSGELDDLPTGTILGGAMWSDGYGGIILNERPYVEEPDIDLGWSDLDRIHAEDPIATAHMAKRAIAHVGQLAGIGVAGLLETFAPDWSSVDPKWGSFSLVEPIFPLNET